MNNVLCEPFELCNIRLSKFLSELIFYRMTETVPATRATLYKCHYVGKVIILTRLDDILQLKYEGRLSWNPVTFSRRMLCSPVVSSNVKGETRSG